MCTNIYSHVYANVYVYCGATKPITVINNVFDEFTHCRL